MNDAPAWEVSKENVQPLARGRDPATLAKVLQVRDQAPIAAKCADPASRDSSEWENRRLWYEAKIADNSADDPLANWVGYTRWLQDTFPSGDPSPDGRYDVSKAIEGTCRAFVGDENYRNDPRYVRAWVRFATIAKDQMEILRYMEANRIGDDLAIYYEARAVAHEQRKEHALASHTYKQGIQKMAAPVDRLRERHKAFEERMVKRMERRRRRENRAPNPNSNPNGQSRRSTLGGLHPQQADQSHRPTSTSQLHAQPPVRPFQPVPAHNSGSGLAIFADDPVPGPTEPESQGVGIFPSQSSGAKENDVPISTWAEAAGVVAAPRPIVSTPFAIHSDTDLKDPQKPKASSSTPHAAAGAQKALPETSPGVSEGQRQTSTETGSKCQRERLDSIGVGSTQRSAVKPDGSISEGRKRLASSPHPSPSQSKKALADTKRDGGIPSSKKTPAPLVRRLAFGAPSSPTIHTKNAIEEVGLMLDSTYPVEQQEEDTLVIPIANEKAASSFTIFQDDSSARPPPETVPQHPLEEDKENGLGTGREGTASKIINENAVLKPRPDLEADPTSVEYVTVDYVEEKETVEASEKLSPILEDQNAPDQADQVEEARVALSSTKIVEAASTKDPRKVVDPFAESVRYEIEENLWDWYEKSPNLYFDGKEARIRKGTVCTIGDRNNSFMEICVQKVLGQGRYAKVYLVEPLNASDPALIGDDEDDICELALKVQKPSCLWEYYVCTELPLRMPSKLKASVNNALAIFEASEGNEMTSYFLMNAGEKGTLHDLVNLYRRDGETATSMEETLVIFFAIELLRMIEGVHSAGFIHTDIKPDNLLVRCEVQGQSLPSWSPEGQNGWDGVGLTLIDFGRSLDLKIYESVCGTTLFEGNHGADTFACQEMVSGLPWRFQSDTYAVAATIHLLLTGKDLKCEYEDGAVRPSLQLKRYWQKEMWEDFFNSMTNVGTGTAEESVAAMKRVRQKFEQHLGENTSKAKDLRGLVLRMAILLREANPADVTANS